VCQSAGWLVWLVQAYEEGLSRLGMTIAKERRAFDAMVLMHQSVPTLKAAENRNPSCAPHLNRRKHAHGRSRAKPCAVVFVYKYMRSEQVRADACVIARGEWNRRVLASFFSRIRDAAQCAAPRTAQCVCRPGPVPLSIAARRSRSEKAIFHGGCDAEQAATGRSSRPAKQLGAAPEGRQSHSQRGQEALFGIAWPAKSKSCSLARRRWQDPSGWHRNESNRA
jgi:hypothetical protein